MLAQDAKNVWLIDLMTDIDLGQKRAPQAIACLQAANAAQNNNPVLQLNPPMPMSKATSRRRPRRS